MATQDQIDYMIQLGRQMASHLETFADDIRDDDEEAECLADDLASIVRSFNAVAAEIEGKQQKMEGI